MCVSVRVVNINDQKNNQIKSVYIFMKFRNSSTNRRWRTSISHLRVYDTQHKHKLIAFQFIWKCNVDETANRENCHYSANKQCTQLPYTRVTRSCLPIYLDTYIIATITATTSTWRCILWLKMFGFIFGFCRI